MKTRLLSLLLSGPVLLAVFGGWLGPIFRCGWHDGN
jgi:hypothetical protein